MVERWKQPLWIPLVLVLALVLGWIGGRAGSSSPSGIQDTSADLALELRALRQTQKRTSDVLEGLGNALAALRVAPALAHAPSPASATREPVLLEPSAPETLETLVRALEAVRLTFERESSRTQALIRSAPAFGGERLVEVRDRRRDADWPALQALEKDWRIDKLGTDRSQYFQTPRDLLEAYGPPTAIYRPKGGLLFHYRQHPEGVPGPSLYFRLQDGIVIEFYVEDDTGEGEEDP